WWFEASAQHRINQNIAFQRFVILQIACGSGDAHRYPHRESLEHLRRVAAQFRGLGQEQSFDCFATLMQLAGGNKSVPPVIALAAYQPKAFCLWVMLHGKARHGGAGILHERERRHTEALAGNAINLSHFSRADDLHGWILKEKALRKWEG